ncbi:SUKH-3 domain-containing protein [Streptomyces sp. NPDC091368]|uniref:SUKH-3 domain-containing protein n=1 Tax=Streptomyces sp. NPDC091368 TaxID=3365993 RepID=UPI003809823E
MPRRETPADIDAWFAEGGWYPGRDVAGRAAVFVAEVVEETRRYGHPVEPFAAATDFLAEHAGVRLTIDARREEYLRFEPVVVWDSTPGDIAELSRNLGVRLFPVGWDSSEGEVIVMDERNRFFCMHHTGDYYLGTGKYEAMADLYRYPMKDAEDFYV